MANATTESTGERLSLRPDPWRIAWNILAGDTLLAFALLALALLIALAGWLPQAPDSANDPMAFSRWLGEAQARFGGTFAFLHQVGLFSLEHSLALRLLIALVAVCLAVRLVESIQAAWSARRFFPVIGRIATYLGAMLVIAGLAISSAAGWRASNLTLGVGQMAPVGHGTPYNLRLDAFDPANVAKVALLREADPIGEGNVAPGRPMRAADLAIFLGGEGPAIRASATLTDGQPVDLQTSATSTPATELVLLLTHDEPDRFFAAPKAGLVIQLSRGAGGSSARVQIYRTPAGISIFEGEIPSDGQLTVENAVLTLHPETYATLDVVRDPGTPLTLSGMAVLGLGLALAAFWPARPRKAVADSSAAQSPTIWQRLLRLIESAWWQAGLAILSVLLCVVTARSLARAGMLLPPGSAAFSFVAAWLAGCVAAIVPSRAAGWATVALAVIALAAVVIWPGIV